EVWLILPSATYRSYLDNIHKAILAQSERQEQILADEENRKCRQDLHRTDPRDDKKRIEQTKGGLLKDSYRWILENSTFKAWLGDHDSRLLWIRGGAGKGKTMLLCGIIDELETSTSPDMPLSYFFCQ